MSRKSVSEILLEAVKEQLKEVEKIRSKVSKGSENEPELKKELDLFNAVTVSYLLSAQEEVFFSWDGREMRAGRRVHFWVTNPDGSKFKFPFQVLKDLDEGLSEKVDKKMSEIQIIDGQIRSFVDPSKAMEWGEFETLRQTVGWEGWKAFLADVAERFGIEGMNPFGAGGNPLWQLGKFRMPLAMVKVTAGAYEENLEAALRWAAEHFIYPDVTDREIFKRYSVAVETFREQRRASRVAVEVRIPRGETRYGRYSYGIRVTSPDGEKYSLVSSGSPSFPVWTFSYMGDKWSRYENDGYNRVDVSQPEMVPCVNVPRFDNKLSPFSCRQALEGMDLEQLPDEDGDWRWVVYLPSKEWKVTGGSTFFMPDRAIDYKAQISK